MPIDTLHTKPQHQKALDTADPLAFARTQENHLNFYRLRAK